MVSGLHDGAVAGAVIKSEGVADLVHGHGVQVITSADVKGDSGIELNVAGDGEIIDRRRHGAKGKSGRVIEVKAAEADVAHPRVALLVVAATHERAVVANYGEVDVGLGRPL